MREDLTAVEDAEVRLEARSAQRREALARRDRRRRRLPWILCPVVLPALGAAALAGVVESAGGVLLVLGQAAAVLGVAAGLLVPAALSAWFGRRHGRADAVLWALVTVAVEVALVFGVAFVALGLGP